MKKELFDLTYAEDRASFNFTRTGKFRSLATQQAPRIAELEQLAEQIRDGLRPLPGLVPAPARAPLPPALTERTLAFVQHRLQVQAETREKLDVIGLQLRAIGVRLGYQFDAETIKTQVVPMRRSALGEAEQKRLAELSARLAALEAEYRSRAEGILARLEELRRDTAAAVGPVAPERIDSLLNDALRYATLQDNEAGYHDYRLAVFEPGLSPEQRRLLFNGAMEKLDLPLPRGEPQPTRRSATW